MEEHGWKKQGGDPAKLADAIVKLAALKEPPTRFAGGADAVQTCEAKAKTLLAPAEAHRELSTALALDDASSVLLQRSDEPLIETGCGGGI